MTTLGTDQEQEQERLRSLTWAHDKAVELFDEVVRRGMVRPGVLESALNQELKLLARETLGVTRYWHKRVVRSGPNTLQPYEENPPDRMLTEDDIVFLDLGPIFEEWEADFGRTFVLGDDPVKQRLRDCLPEAFVAGKRYFDEHPDVTGEEMYRVAGEIAAGYGWELGGEIAGHVLGEFPHEKIDPDEVEAYVIGGNSLPMRSIDPRGRSRHWILELHFVDRERQIGGFYEDLLTID